jgi:glycosyl transferase family 25
MFEFIDKVIYINLEHRTDRREQIEKQLLPYFSPDKIFRLEAIKHEFGAFGCTKSHIAALEFAKKNGWKNVLVLEDDSVWNNFDESYKKLEDLASRPYDVILLGCRAPWYFPQNFRMVSSLSTNAYLVNKDYYATLIDNFKTGLCLFLESRNNEQHALDTYWHRLMKVDQWFGVIPSLMVQSESYSDVLNKHVNGRDDFW